MKKIFFTAITLALSKMTFAQQTNLQDFNMGKKSINQKGFIVLGSWSAANIIYGSIAAQKTEGAQKHFHQMNAMWNGITLALVSFGYLSSRKNKSLNFSETLKSQSSIEKLFLLNAGLDVAYIAGGLYMAEKAKTDLKHADRNKGFGTSIILKGSVLLLFDAVMYSIHQQHGKQLYKLADKVEVASTGNGLGVVVKL